MTSVHTLTGIQMEMDYRFAVGLGIIPTQTKVAVYGHNPSPTLGADIWEGTGVYPFQTSQVKLEILSTSVNDTAAGTGARTVEILGLDINYNPISEIISVNGTSVVPSVNTYFRVNSFGVVTAGSGQTNAGDITLRLANSGVTQAIMRAGFGFSKSCIYTVPAGFSFTITDFIEQVGGNGASINITYGICKIKNGVLIIQNEFNTIPGNMLERKPVLGNLVTEKTTLTTRITSINGSPSGLYSTIAGILIDNTSLL